MNDNHLTTPSLIWKLANRSLNCARFPLLMGIVNVTPDSFSDGGQFVEPGEAVEHALRLVEHGADILDIGGESTRPYSESVTAEEEARRVLPVIREICRQTTVPVSIDTSKSIVAQAAIESGAEIINDITGLQGDPRMVEVARQSRAAVCAMHMRGTPQTMQDAPVYEDVVQEVHLYLQQRRDTLIDQGIDRTSICLDPGIGFGKTSRHNIALLSNCETFLQLDCPILIGHSRKGFIQKVLNDPEADRTAATIGVALSLAARGIHILRVHDVEPVRQALVLFDATGGLCRT